MKNYFLIAIVALSLSACNRAELERANRERDSLQNIVAGRDSSLNQFISSFNDVERNLDSVAIRQNIISQATDKTSGELKENQKERINSEIAAINNLMEENRKKIADLTRKLKGSTSKNVQLQKMIATLNDQLTQKGVELAALNEKLNALNVQVTQLQSSVDTLTVQNTAKTKTIAETTTALHTAYYVVGKTKELQDAQLIDRKGGLLGIGKTSKLSSNFDNSKFTKIDYTQTTTIPVNSSAKIITSHPTDSYNLETDEKNKKMVKNIVITNPERFWSASKYLVVMKD